MPRSRSRSIRRSLLWIASLALGCAREPGLLPPETFSWAGQSIAFSPPPERWRREAENSRGFLGVRFVLSGGLGESITVATARTINERDRRDALARLSGRRDSLSQSELLHELSLARARTDDPLSQDELVVALAINQALDRAASDLIGGHPSFVDGDLQEARRAAESYEPTLAELLPRLRLQPERMQEPGRWRIGYEHDTTLAGHPAFAADDTLITPERPMLYRQVFWVVRGRPFEAIYQGTSANLPVFERLVSTIQFPGGPDVAGR